MSGGKIDGMLKKFTNVSSSVEVVGPDQAKEYLQRNVNNRKVDKNRVNQYARDMQAGKFTDGSPVMFFVDGCIADGQHRLMAVVQSGATVVLTVIRNLDPMSRLNHNIGKPQNATANLMMASQSSEVYGVGTTQATAFVRTLIEIEIATIAARLSPSELCVAIDKMHLGLRFASPYVRKKRRGISVAAVWAGIIAASYHVDNRLLASFCEVFSGKRNANSETEGMVMRFANLMAISPHGGHDLRRSDFMRAQRCIKAFVDGEALNRFHSNMGIIYSAKRILGEATNDAT